MVIERWLGILPLVLLTGCAGFQTNALPPAPPAPPPLAEPRTVEKGLTPMISAEQLRQALPLGRPDPFAPPPVVSTTGSGPSRNKPQLPSDLRLSGVIVTQGRAQALVERGDRSGSLGLGDRGTSGSESLLPPGWTVASIDSRDCVLTLRQGKLTAVVLCPRMGLASAAP